MFAVGQNNMDKPHPHSFIPQEIQRLEQILAHDNARPHIDRRLLKSTQVHVNLIQQAGCKHNRHPNGKASGLATQNESTINNASPPTGIRQKGRSSNAATSAANPSPQPAVCATPHKSHFTSSSKEISKWCRESSVSSHYVSICDQTEKTPQKRTPESILPQNLPLTSIPTPADPDTTKIRSSINLANLTCTVDLCRLRDCKEPRFRCSNTVHTSSSNEAAVPSLISQTLPLTLKNNKRQCSTNEARVHSFKQCSCLPGKPMQKNQTPQLCHCNKLKCADKLSKIWQKQLRSKFWDSDNLHCQSKWILNYTLGLKNAKLVPWTKAFIRRKWFLPDSEGNLINVSRVFFLQTLSYSWNSLSRFMQKNFILLKNRSNVKLCSTTKNSSSVKVKDGKRLIFTYITSFLKKYHAPIRKSNGSCEHVHDYNLVKRSFKSFTARHSYFTVAYTIFRDIFYIVFGLFTADPTYLSIMPPVWVLEHAYQTCDLLHFKQKYISSDTEISRIAIAESSAQSHKKEKSLKGIDICKGHKKSDDGKKVIMHIDVDNDDIVITQNASDSDTDDEEVDSQTAYTRQHKTVSDSISQSQTAHASEEQHQPVSDCTIQRRITHANTRQHAVHNKTYQTPDSQIKFEFEETKEQRPLLPPCKCRLKCSTKISESRREEIYTSFWRLGDLEKKKQWLEAHTHTFHRKRRLKGRNHVRKTYILINDANKSVIVCTVFFQRTLGLTGSDWLNSLSRSSSGGIQSLCLSQNHVDRMNVCIRRSVEQFVKSQIALSESLTSCLCPDARSAKKPMKILHSKYVTTYPHLPVSLERFQVIYHQVCKSTCQQSGMKDNENSKPDSSIILRSSPSERDLRHASRCLLKNSERKDSGIPKRRTSTRTARKQGNLVEVNSRKISTWSDSVSSIVSTQKHQSDVGRMNNSCPESKPKLCQVYSLNKYSVKKSGKSYRSSEINMKDINPNWQQQRPASIQPVDKSESCRDEEDGSKEDSELCRHRDAKSRNEKQRRNNKTQRSVSCKNRTRKEKNQSLKKNRENPLTSNIKRKAKVTKISKPRSRLGSLKKKLKHPLLPPCNCSRRRCIDKISEEKRKKIHETFWNLSGCDDRKRWLLKYVEKREQKIKILSLFPQRRNASKKYFLPDITDHTVEVCRLFFLHTLGFRWDSGVDALVKTKSSTKIVQQSHRWKKPVRKLPDYIIDSVQQYLKSVRDYKTKTDDHQTNVSVAQSEGVDELKIDDLRGIKVKDLFNGWKAKFRNLKFNLGYHSFRRIFQSVVDPVGDRGEDIRKTLKGRLSADSDSLVDKDGDEQHPCLLSHSKTLSAINGFKSHESDQPEICNLDNVELTTSVVYGNPDTEGMNTSLEFSKSSCADPVMKNKPSDQNDDGSVSKNFKSCGRDHSMEDTGDCVLDVSSGYFKQTDNSDKYLDYNGEYQHKKRRSLSTRNDRNNYPVLPPCKCRKRKCADKFSGGHRQHINDIFWSLNGYNERKQWILEHIKRADIRRRVVFTEGTPRKLESRWYYLPDKDGNKVDVCKAFFLRTLGYRWDSVIDTIGRTTPKGDKWVVPDKRGRKPPPHKISDEAVSSMTLYIENVCHIYQPLCSKKTQESLNNSRSSCAGVVPFGLTMKQLFEDYKSKHQSHKFGYESFRKIFRRIYASFQVSLASESIQEQEEIGAGDKEGMDPAQVECSGSFQTENSHFIGTAESCTDLSQCTTTPPPPSLPRPPSPHPQQPPQQLVGSNASHHGSCLYQYNYQQYQPPPPLPAMHSTGPPQPDQHNPVDHDTFLKYNPGLYCQPSGMPGQFPQISNPDSYSSSINSRTTDAISSSICTGQSHFPAIFMPNPEPLRRPVFHISCQYQSILHQIAESSRFFDYGNYPQPGTTYQRPNNRYYPYPKQDFPGDTINLYNVHKTSDNVMSSTTPTQYPPMQHLSHNSRLQGNASIHPSSYPDDNDNCIHNQNDAAGVKVQNDAAGVKLQNDATFGNEFIGEITEKKPALKERHSSKKPKTSTPKLKRENKLKPKSSRNYGDHYPMLSPCNCKKKKCIELFPESDRTRIHDHFWNLKDYNERKQWMLVHIKREDCKRRRIDQFESFRKQESRWYFFPDENGKQHEVCKDFFLRTLGYKWDSVIDTIRRTTPKGETSTRPDQRGRKAPAHKLSSIVLRSVVQYIESMQQVSLPHIPSCTFHNGPLHDEGDPSCHPNISDGAGSNMETSGGQIAIPYGLTMKDLYDDYKAKHVEHKIGYESFRRIFRAISKSEKIAFDDRATGDGILNSDDHDLIDL